MHGDRVDTNLVPAGAVLGRAFTYQALPMRVIFGPGSLRRLPDEVAALGRMRVAVLCAPGQEEAGKLAADVLGHRAAGVLAVARMHVPIEVANDARRRAASLGADSYVAVGGGSAIGLAKALVLHDGLPIIAVPTTYAGSEMTAIWGVTVDGAKRTGRDTRVLPASVVYDPELTLDLPGSTSASSGMNAIAHAVEGLYAPDVSPIISLMAEEGIGALVSALPRVVADGHDIDARTEAQYGAWLCGAVLGATTMSLHHKLCHVLGGALGLPHAHTHTVVLPHVLAFNSTAAPHVLAALSRVFGGGIEPARALWQLAGRLGAPRSLRKLGMDEQEIPGIAEHAVAEPYANPRPVSREAVEAILRASWAGEPPPQR